MEIKEDQIEVIAYSQKKLAEYLSVFSKTDLDEVLKKNHLGYFDGYLQRKDVKNMLIEYPYIDKDYLQDYSAYYARSFSSDYQKRAMRIHFFKKEVTRLVITKHLEKKEDNLKAIQKGYVGYMVVKPIPQRMIGKTLLNTYPENNGEGRIYPIKRQYQTHLFGIELSLDTIGYQEQDRAVAACATSALWSIFQSTALLFQHSIPSPAEITEMASENAYITDRSFPSKGLTMEQIANCVKAVKLEPQCYDVYSYHILKGYIKAYLNAQIPVLLGVSLFNPAERKFLGDHAVAVTGLSEAIRERSNYFGLGNSTNRLYLRSSRIDQVFVHDDQVGPFARMQFDDPYYRKVVIKKNDTNIFYASLSTSWKPDEGETGDIRAVPNTIMVPLYHKIRISFDDILSLVDGINFKINDRAAAPDDLPSPEFELVEEWDIVLERNSEFKKKVFKKQPPYDKLNGSKAKTILSKSMPKFFWRAAAYSDGEVRFEILFDATDIPEGKLFLEFISYDENYCKFLKKYLAPPRTTINDAKLRQVRYCLKKIVESI